MEPPTCGLVISLSLLLPNERPTACIGQAAADLAACGISPGHLAHLLVILGDEVRLHSVIVHEGVLPPFCVVPVVAILQRATPVKCRAVAP
eukprot:scaffold3929_cov291-Pinguiococcus_pyrenoidosus.AAC.10